MSYDRGGMFLKEQLRGLNVMTICNDLVALRSDNVSLLPVVIYLYGRQVITKVVLILVQFLSPWIGV